jgi:stage II sporulation protein D
MTWGRTVAIRLVIVALTVLLVMDAGLPGPAAAEPPPVEVVSIELVGHDGTRFVVNDRPYAGPVVLTAYRDGIALTERATIEQYLQGIAEMPFLWDEEALAAQAVAARTYLARRLLGGRRGDAARYDYDICATNVCQVYRGTQLVEGDHGDRWQEAVESTAGEVVLYNGRPIEAVYTSMVGSRSRANQDVWSSDPVPYLQPVDSPEVGIAPYAQWTVTVTASQFVQILRAGGLDVGGDLDALVVDDPPEGGGRTDITVISSRGIDSILAPAMKGLFNRHADDLYPGSLPAVMDNGVRLPEPLPSYTYDLEHVSVPPRIADAMLPAEDRVDRDLVRIEGEGWGHGVGMSQWGARIMANDGSTYDEILSHYYGGLEPQEAPTLVPESVVVGLATERQELRIETTGTADLFVNGVPFGAIPAGTWIVRSTAGGLALIPIGDTPAQPAIGDRHWPR